MSIRAAQFFAAIAFVASASPVFAAHSIAAAESGDEIRYYWNTNQPSRKIAEQKVMKTCSDNAKRNNHKGKCKLLGSGTGPKYIVFFHTKSGSGFGVSSNGNRQQAIDDAYTECTKQGECPDTAAKVDFDEGEQPLRQAKAVTVNDNCSPPAGKTLRYSDRCFNGDCTRTFENGCTKRFQAPYCYDSFQQKWDWKPNGC